MVYGVKWNQIDKKNTKVLSELYLKPNCLHITLDLKTVVKCKIISILEKKKERENPQNEFLRFAINVNHNRKKNVKLDLIKTKNLDSAKDSD